MFSFSIFGGSYSHGHSASKACSAVGSSSVPGGGKGSLVGFLSFNVPESKKYQGVYNFHYFLEDKSATFNNSSLGSWITWGITDITGITIGTTCFGSNGPTCARPWPRACGTPTPRCVRRPWRRWRSWRRATGRRRRWDRDRQLGDGPGGQKPPTSPKESVVLRVV
jgi:hypothetical protein